MSYIDELETSYGTNGVPKHMAFTQACQQVDSLRAQLAALRRELDEARRDGERRFPGFSLHENPVRVQRLGFAWLDEKKQHRTVEFANYDTHPMMVANQLRGLAEAIEEAHMDKESPLGRASRPSKP